MRITLWKENNKGTKTSKIVKDKREQMASGTRQQQSQEKTIKLYKK